MRLVARGGLPHGHRACAYDVWRRSGSPGASRDVAFRAWILVCILLDLSCESRIGVQPFLCWACALVRVQGGILDLLWMLLGVARSVQPAVRGAFFAGSRSRGVTVRLSWRTCGNAGMDLLIGIGFLGNDSRTPRRTLPFS